MTVSKHKIPFSASPLAFFINEAVFATGMGEVPEWLLFDQQDVHDTLVATSKHKPHLIADMAAMANVPGLANGQARRPVVLQTQHYASQVCQLHGSMTSDLTDLTQSMTFALLRASKWWLLSCLLFGVLRCCCLLS